MTVLVCCISSEEYEVDHLGVVRQTERDLLDTLGVDLLLLVLLVEARLGHPHTVPGLGVTVLAEARSDPRHTFLPPVGPVTLLGHLGTLLLATVLVQQADVETAGQTLNNGTRINI